MAKDETTDEEIVDLPLTTKANDVETLVLIKVFDGFARVGATRTNNEAELTAAVSGLPRSAGTVALFRVADDALLADVVRAARGTRSGGIDVRVLGSVAPFEPPPEKKWDACPFPAASDLAGVDDLMVKVLVEDDTTGQAGVVHVRGRPPFAFAWAAATCVTLQHFDAAGALAGRPRFGHPLGVHFAR